MTERLQGTHALVPLKEPDRGKSRLGSVLRAVERERLVVTMLADVTACLARVADIRSVSVLTRAAALLPRGCVHVPDRGRDLNVEIASAARELQGAGARAMLVLPADIPFVTPEDILALLTASRDAPIVAAPDWTETGTNALLLAPPLLIPTHFGPGSLAAHEAAARDAGVSLRRVSRPGLGCDIDEPQQLAMLLEKGGQRYAFLAHTPRQVS